jgi:signal transduction histidine kinase
VSPAPSRVSTLSAINERHRIALHVRLALDLPPVLGDSIQLQQVLLNLTLNACQAMRHTGPGAKEPELERIFDPFVRRPHLGNP